MDKKILIFSDLDGTALADDFNFSEFTKDIVKQCYAQGIYFIPCTARNVKDVFNKAIDLKIDTLKGISVANNGSQIYDYNKKQWIKNTHIEQSVVEDIFHMFFETYIAKVVFVSEHSNYVYAYSENSAYWSEVMGLNYHIIDSPEKITEQIAHLTIVWKKDLDPSIKLTYMQLLEEKYGRILQLESYSERVYEIATPNSSKGSAIDEVVKYLGLKRNEVKVYAFGDGGNDRSMIKAADVGVAMINGLEDLKQIADDVTKYSNIENGVAHYIQENIFHDKKT